MPPAVKQLWTRALTQFRAFSVARRAVMIGAAVGVLVLVMVFSRWSGKTDMAALYTDLPAADAAQITERLSSKGVKYELADQGTTVKLRLRSGRKAVPVERFCGPPACCSTTRTVRTSN